MNSSGRKLWLRFLPLLVLLAACTDPAVVIDEAADVDTCEWLIPVGIELVNDYVDTLPETDINAAVDDPDLLPTPIVALNARGAELDRRAVELSCNIEELNAAIAEATASIESSDPVVQVFLETVRAGVVGEPPMTTTTTPTTTTGS